MAKGFGRTALVTAVAAALPLVGLSWTTAAHSAVLAPVGSFVDAADDTDYHLTGTTSLVMTPDGKYVYAAASSLSPSAMRGFVTTYGRDATTGQLSELAVISATEQPSNGAWISALAGVTRLDLTSDGKWIHAASLNGAGITALAVQSDTGSLSREYSAYPATAFSTNGARFAHSQDGEYLYYVYQNAPGVTAFHHSGAAMQFAVMTDAYASGSMKPEMVAALTNPQDIALSPDDTTLYVVGRDKNGVGGDLVVLARDATNGMMSGVEVHVASDTVTGLTDPRAVVVSGDGKFVYVASDGAVATFSRAVDGKLTFVESTVWTDSAAGIDVLAGAQALALSNDGARLFVGTASKTIAVFARNEASGKLTTVGYVADGVDGTAIGAVQQLVVSADGASVYAATNGSVDGVTTFSAIADLSVVVQASAAKVAPGGNFNYTVTVTNSGAADALAAQVTITSPKGVTLSNVQGPDGVDCVSADTGWQCQLGTVKAGAESLVITADAAAPTAEGSVTATVSVTSDSLDSDASNDSDDVTTSVTTTAPDSPSSPGASSDGGGGGGGSINWVWLLLGGIAGAARLRGMKK